MDVQFRNPVPEGVHRVCDSRVTPDSATKPCQPASAGLRRAAVLNAWSVQESAALLCEASVEVRLHTCARELVLRGGPAPPHWQPDALLGRSWALYGVVYQAALFRYLPEQSRLHLALRTRPLVCHRPAMVPAGGTCGECPASHVRLPRVLEVPRAITSGGSRGLTPPLVRAPCATFVLASGV
jgi:hypothetical protein